MDKSFIGGITVKKTILILFILLILLVSVVPVNNVSAVGDIVIELGYGHPQNPDSPGWDHCQSMVCICKDITCPW